MPNCTENTITFRAIEEAVTVRSTVGDDFDFNALIPMPEELMVESRSRMGPAIAWALSEEGRRDVSEAELFPYKRMTWGESPEKLLERARERAEETIDGMSLSEYGMRLMENQRRFGAATWYEWCNEHWGTKWNACNARWDGLSVAFDTAWAAPGPIFGALMERFPEMPMEISWANEEELYTVCHHISVHGDGMLGRWDESVPADPDDACLSAEEEDEDVLA